MNIEQRRKAYMEYMDLNNQCRQCEDEFLDLPRSEAKKAGMDVGLLFTTTIKEALKQKYRQLVDLEAKKRAALERFRQLLG